MHTNLTIGASGFLMQLPIFVKTLSTADLTKRERLHEIIFEADTPMGKRFDVVLLWAILLSVLVVMLESISKINETYGPWLRSIEWILTGLFTLEYLARIWVVRKPLRYMGSFFGIIDLLSILPSFLAMFLASTSSLRVIRILRLLRVFRVFKLIGFLQEAKLLRSALVASQKKIIIFLMTVLSVVVILGTLMYIIEDAGAGYTSIPRSIYWAIVTLTTVGYGDIAPQTPLGQLLASVVMILGYAIIAVPTGIVTAQLGKGPVSSNTRTCLSCSKEGHEDDAKFCKFCGEKLD